MYVIFAVDFSNVIYGRNLYTCAVLPEQVFLLWLLFCGFASGDEGICRSIMSGDGTAAELSGGGGNLCG